MAYMWPSSLVPWLDAYGNPYAGAKVFFFNPGTTTPKTTYTDGDLSIPHDHPVLANGFGRFPAIFMEGTGYRVRIESSDGATVEDVDDISIPMIGDGGGGGDTPIDLLARTGDLKDRYDTGTHSGWVRANGRTIGNGTSGATERANDDTAGLFEHLWGVDSALTVSGGRGANAESDFAANKTITLPDFRQLARIGLSGMGNSVATLIAASKYDGEDGDSIGALVGDGTITLTAAQMPEHNHTGTALSNGGHSHGVPGGYNNGNLSLYARSRDGGGGSISTSNNGAHTHNLSINDAGGDEAHDNVQPSKAVTVYIKL